MEFLLPDCLDICSLQGPHLHPPTQFSFLQRLEVAVLRVCPRTSESPETLSGVQEINNFIITLKQNLNFLLSLSYKSSRGFMKYPRSSTYQKITFFRIAVCILHGFALPIGICKYIFITFNSIWKHIGSLFP
uniref:Uncharacterized protein n=1 Tax=Molossus molossus TaxID=27622 RepID=A0A7J8JVQ1_MOLMO|nr:hypothetical protein HJG59_007960 [Molossus molossus]